MSFRNFGRLLLSAVFTVTAILLVLALVLYAKIEPQLPSIESLKDVQLQVPLRIYTSDRKLMAEFGEKRRTPVRMKSRHIRPRRTKAWPEYCC